LAKSFVWFEDQCVNIYQVTSCSGCAVPL